MTEMEESLERAAEQLIELERALIAYRDDKEVDLPEDTRDQLWSISKDLWDMYEDTRDVRRSLGRSQIIASDHPTADNPPSVADMKRLEKDLFRKSHELGRFVTNTVPDSLGELLSRFVVASARVEQAKDNLKDDIDSYNKWATYANYAVQFGSAVVAILGLSL
jgi:hypothetical protein